MNLAPDGDLEPRSSQVAVVDLRAAPRGVLTPRPADRVGQGRRLIDIVEEWDLQSSPASDPPASW